MGNAKALTGIRVQSVRRSEMGLMTSADDDDDADDAYWSVLKCEKLMLLTSRLIPSSMIPSSCSSPNSLPKL